MKNLFTESPDTGEGETLERLAQGREVRIERIVSHGEASEPDFWYDQDEDEWVAVLEGCATLRFESPDETMSLNRGDWVHVPAHRRHRVESTTSPTVWLAVFFRD